MGRITVVENQRKKSQLKYVASGVSNLYSQFEKKNFPDLLSILMSSNLINFLTLWMCFQKEHELFMASPKTLVNIFLKHCILIALLRS